LRAWASPEQQPPASLRCAGQAWSHLFASSNDWPYAWLHSVLFEANMAFQQQPKIKLLNTDKYRENYANAVQIRHSLWDFFLVFGTLQPSAENEVEIHNFEGIYLSPQQAKALLAVLQQNVANYESTFGEIKLDPRALSSGVVN
jgi:flagellar protein FlaG